MAKKDFYDVLGVKRDASESDIKKAYRRLARKHHPDVNPGDTASEEKFKEISEAYEVLTDPEKKKNYDRFGHAGPGPQGFEGFGGGAGGAPGGGNFRWSSADGTFDFSDLFGDLFGGGGQRGAARKTSAERGSDMEYEMEVSFAESVLGTQKEIAFTRPAPCPTCGGKGYDASKPGGECPECRGRGRVDMRMGPIATQQPCRRCNGTGRLPGPTCTSCGGSGARSKSERLRVKIPAGVETGSKVRIAGHGEAGRNGGPAGDLYIRVKVRPDERFRRQGDDIVTTARVPLADALLGGSVTVETLGDPVRMKIPAGSQNGQRFRIKGKGVGGHGHLYAELHVEIPKKLDPETREAMEKLRDRLGGE